MYYPFDEGRAGTLRDRHLTSNSSEYLLADREIISLAKEILTAQEYSEAEELAKKLVGPKKERDSARARLMEIVKPPPKRPIYYARDEIRYLPRWTRDALRYFGDFVDMLVKSAVYEKIRTNQVFHFSFGPAIDMFQKYWQDSKVLVDFLKRYNRFLYRDAKHDFRLPIGRKKHRFTSREVVLSAFITMKIADQITAISSFADKVRQDKPIP